MNDRYYAAYINNDEQRRKSSSGGLANAICEYMLQKGAIIYGVEYSKDFKSAGYSKILEANELYRLNGSKYVTTDKHLSNGTNVFEDIYNNLINNQSVVFVGTPCEVGALYRYCRNKGCQIFDKLLTIDFICQGPVDASVQKEYIDYLEKKYNSVVVEFSVRYKNPLWKPVYLRAKFQNGREHLRPLYDTDFGRAFMIYGQDKCYNCRFKAEGHCADITLGDFWGLSSNDIGFNEFGTSVVIVHNKHGIEVFNELKTVSAVEYNEKKAIGENPMYTVSRKQHASLEQFKYIYAKHGLHKAVFWTRSNFSKIKYLLQLAVGMKPY